jgi:Cu2+-exporting ATPase
MGPWSLGRAGWSDSGPPGPETVLAKSGAPVARFCFSDTLRADAVGEVNALSKMGFGVHILSGDDPSKVASVARLLGIANNEALGGMTAAAKADWIEKRTKSGVLMLGDGINDSLAFDRALCRGTPVGHRGILEAKADFYYLQRGLAGIRSLFGIERALRRTKAWVIGFSIAYNILAAGFAAAGMINPLVAAILMPLSSVLSVMIVGVGMRGACSKRASTPSQPEAAGPKETGDQTPALASQQPAATS